MIPRSAPQLMRHSQAYRLLPRTIRICTSQLLVRHSANTSENLHSASSSSMSSRIFCNDDRVSMPLGHKDECADALYQGSVGADMALQIAGLSPNLEFHFITIPTRFECECVLRIRKHRLYNTARKNFPLMNSYAFLAQEHIIEQVFQNKNA